MYFSMLRTREAFLSSMPVFSSAFAAMSDAANPLIRVCPLSLDVRRHIFTIYCAWDLWNLAESSGCNLLYAYGMGDHLVCGVGQTDDEAFISASSAITNDQFYLLKGCAGVSSKQMTNNCPVLIARKLLEHVPSLQLLCADTEDGTKLTVVGFIYC